MATDETDTKETETDEPNLTEKPEVTDEHKEKAKEMGKAYDDDRPTIGLPGTSNTVAGQAVGEWVDDDGSPKFGDAADIKREDVMGVRQESMSDSDDFKKDDPGKDDDSAK